MNIRRKFFIALSVSLMCSLVACQSGRNSQPKSALKELQPPQIMAVHFDWHNVSWVKEQLRSNNPYYVQHYQTLLEQAQQALHFRADPVTNKTQLPASGDIHDYLSYAPYRWPNPATESGLPWIARDGVINPISQGRDTDFTRASEFFTVVETLAWTFYFSEQQKYADKLIELITIWYLQPETKVNPNINYGQAVPGVADGRKAGIQEWHRQSHVITALQILEAARVLPVKVKSGMHQWFSEYLNWLMTDNMAKSAGLTAQNHATLYSKQIIGLMIYLGRYAQAKREVEALKETRIAVQILPNGIQPKEIGRTRSVHYVVYNTWALTELLAMGRKLDIDLWQYQTVDGRSVKKAYEFILPYANAEKVWQHQEVSNGGAEQIIQTELLPMLVKASSILGVNLVKPAIDTTQNLTPIEALTYPLPQRHDSDQY